VKKRIHPRRLSGEGTDAIEALFQSLRNDLEEYLVTRLGSRQEAEELAQEAYERLIRRRRRGSIDYWEALLFRTARHLAFNRLRQRRLRGAATMIIEVKDDRTPDIQLEEAQLIELIEEAIEQLPERSQKVIGFMRGHPPLTFEEIAKRLQVCKKTIARDYKSAIAFIQSALGFGGARRD
jgi:RNA polymerase sigma-70 factor (ECF subfamily)